MSTCTKTSKKLDAGKSLAAAPPGPECDSTSPGLTRDGGPDRVALSYHTPARTLTGPLVILSERTSVWTSRVVAPDVQPVTPPHGNPGGGKSILSLTVVLAVPTATPLTSLLSPSWITPLRPTSVSPSYRVGLFRICVVAS